jgi:hypothetical protein
MSLIPMILLGLNGNYGMLFESQPRGYSNVEMKSDVITKEVAI